MEGNKEYRNKSQYLLYDKGSISNQREEDGLFNKLVLGLVNILKETTIGLLPYAIYKNNFLIITHLNVKQ